MNWKFWKKKKYQLAFVTLPIVVVVILLKYVAHYFNIEFLNLNALFTAIISANIFLIGFLISGTMSDYKESEKLPGDLASSIQSIFDEIYITHKNKNDVLCVEILKRILNLNSEIILWFHKKSKTEEIYQFLFNLNDDFLRLEALTQASFIVRIKNEQASIRRIVTRIHSIRETSFLMTGYAVAEIITGLLIIGLIFLNLNPFHESIFFVSFVTFIMVYMILFIKDLDNPFSYYQADGMVEEVSLKPLVDSRNRIENLISNIETNKTI
jgi:hypothetical protein